VAAHTELSLGAGNCQFSGKRHSHGATVATIESFYGVVSTVQPTWAQKVKKRELKTALKAAAELAREREFVIIGSQAIHAQCQHPPAEVLLSQECDLYPRNHPEAATLLDRELGRNSAFARKHGFYVDVVTPEIATLPPGWEKRMKRLCVGSITAYCLEMHDLLASKLAAGRLKDLELAGAMLKLQLASVRTLRARVAKLLPAAAKIDALCALTNVLRDVRRKATSGRSH